MMINKYKEALQREKGKQSVLQKQLEQFVSTRETLENRAKAIQEAQLYIQKVAVETQAKVVVKIEAIVNKVIQTVFPEYSFELKYEIKRGKSEAQLKFYKGQNEINVFESDGGGVSDVCAIALRLAVWSLSSTADIMLLDEPDKCLSVDLRPRFSEVLHELSNKLNLQIITPSHSVSTQEIADKCFTMTGKKEGEWIISKVS